MRSQSILAIFGVTAILVAVAGCGDSGDSGASGGGGSDGGGGESAGLTKAQFVKQANEACSEERETLLEQTGAYFKKNEKKSLPEARLMANLFRDVYVPAVESELTKIRELEPPASDRAEVEAMLDAEEAAIAKVRELKKAESPEEFGQFFAQPDKQLRAYGLDQCAKSG